MNSHFLTLPLHTAPAVVDQIIRVQENIDSYSIVGTVSVADQDDAQRLSCNITGSSPSIAGKIFLVDNQYMTNTQTTIAAGTVHSANIVVGDLGQLNTTIDYEAIRSYELTMVFFDDFAKPLHSSAVVIIEVLDVNEPPTFVFDTSITRSIDENSANTNVGGTIAVTDPENQPMVFTIINTDAVPFTIDATSGQLTTTALNNAPYLDFEYVSYFDVEVLVDDTLGNHKISTIVRVTLRDVNEAPVILKSSINNLKMSISESTSEGTVLGTVISTDVDAETVLSMSISSSPVDGIFSIGNTGVVRVENAANLDYEALATVASTVSFPATVNSTLDGSFDVGTHGCTGYLECQFGSLPAALEFCKQEPECIGVMHDTTNTVNCQRDFGCFYPRNGATTTAYGGRTSYLKTHTSDPLAKLIVTITASDSLMQDFSIFEVQIKDANDVYISTASNLDPELFNAEDGSEATFSTAGNEFVYLYGFNFGPIEASIETLVTARYGANSQYKATDCIVFSSNTVIRCTTSPGVGRGLPWSVTVGSYTANQVGATLSYAAPTVTGAPSVEAVYGVGTQGQCLDSSGSKPPSEKFIVGSDLECRQLCSLCSVRKTCAACVAYDFHVMAHECNLYKTLVTSANGKPRRRCYRKLTSTSALAFRTVGGDPFAVSGENFGPIGTKISLFYGPSTNLLVFAALECAVSQAHTQITCVSAPGVGSNLAVTLSVAGQTATAAGLLTYAHPAIEDISAAPTETSINFSGKAFDGTSIDGDFSDSDAFDELEPPQNFPTSGGTLVDITGFNLPPLGAVGVDVQTILHVTYGPTGFDFNAVNCRVLQSGMVIRCETSPGYGANHYWRVRVDSLESALSLRTTGYAKPSISSCFGPACLQGSTAGGQVLVLFGNNLFGPISTVRYGTTGTEYLGLICVQMKEHVAITCLTSPGTGNNHKWVVRMGEQTSEMTDILSGYAAPALNTITGDGSIDASTLGGQSVRISGTNFPPYGSTLIKSNTVVTYSNGLQTFAANNCVLVYEDRFASQAFIDCETVASTGENLQWSVIVDEQPSKPPTTSTAPPTVHTIEGRSTAASTTEGGTSFSLVGTEFGPVGLSAPSIEVTYGPTAREYMAVGCSVTQVDSTGNSTITCASAEGSGKDLPVLVTVTGQPSDIYASINSGVLFSYAPPKIVAISDSIVNTGSAREIQLFGANFGERGANTSVTFGGGKVSTFRHVSHVEIRFVVPDWQLGRANPIVVTVKEQISNAMYINFNAPSVFDIGQSSEFTSIYTGTTIYIKGESFGASSATGRVLIDGLPCVVNSWSHTHIECETLDLEGELQVIVGDQGSDVVNDFSVQKFLLKPQITSMSIEKGSPLGGYFVTLVGSDFADETVATVSIGNKLCEVGDSYPGSSHQDTVITCLVPSGEGRVNVTVAVEWRTSEAWSFEYTNPVIDSYKATDHNTLGGAVVTLVGKHLGSASVVFWDGLVSVQTKGTSIGANGSHVSTNATTAFCDNGCVDRKLQNPCTHPSCMACQWYLRKYCHEDNGHVNSNELCSEECIASDFSLASDACTVPLLRVVAQCPGKLTNKSDIVIVNQTSTEVSFIVPPGEGMQHEIQMVQIGGVKSNIKTFDYDRPDIGGLSTVSSNTGGEGVLTVFGTNFGESPNIQIVHRKRIEIAEQQQRLLLETTDPTYEIVVAKTEVCEIIPAEQTHESVSCFIPAGQGNLHMIVIETAGQMSPGISFGYDGPTLESITPDSGDTKGNFEVTLTGTNFGLNATLQIGNRTATIVTQNHTHLVALAPGGIGVNNLVTLDVEGQISNSLNLSYFPPSIVVIYPNPANAHSGEIITIEGKNFGSEGTNVTVEIGGEPCTNAQWVNTGGHCNETDSKGKPVCRPLIQCMSPPLQVIGGVSVYVNVAEQEVFIGADDTPVLSLSCPFNMYGLRGELCRDCPVGALCPGNGKDPLSLAGWWSVDRDTFVQCIPASACIGNNTCAAGYEQGVKYCAQCASKTEDELGHYRVDLSCNQCSEIAPFWFGIAILAILGFVTIIWILTTWEFRLASLNIMIDFLQVMALCASIKLKWNAAGENGWALSLLEGSTLFAFNLQGFMPECVFEGWNYEYLWWYLMLTPPAVLVLVWTASVLHMCGGKSKVVRGNKVRKRSPQITPGATVASSKMLENKSSESASLLPQKKRKRRPGQKRRKRVQPNPFAINAHGWGAYMIIMYYLFAPIVTRVWEPFDCAEFDVGANRTFFTMEADPTEQCFGSEDSTYWVRMSVFASFLGIFYTFVLPTLLFLTFYRYRHAIEKDLIRSQTHETEGQSWRGDLAVKRLQAQFRGSLARKSHGTKMFFARKMKVHDTSVIRKHYGKLYEDFQPQYYYWRFVLVARKILLTVTIFLPSSSPVFQATIAIVILFASFVLQVKYQPYLQRASHPVGRTTKDDVKDGNVIGLFGALTKGHKSDAGERTSLLASHSNGSGDGDDNDLAKKRWKRAILVTRTEIRWHHVARKKAKDLLSWLFDYNSLEQMALSCAIMVLLNGIMLETNALRAPVLGVLKIAPQALTDGFVQFIDVLTVVMFLIPCTLLPFSMIVDVWRNMAFAVHNRANEKKKREVAIIAARVEAADKNREQTKVEKWKSIQKPKLEIDLSLLNNRHEAIMKTAKIHYEEDRFDCEETLKLLLTERVRLTELQALMRKETPSNAVEAEKMSMDLKTINSAKSAMDDRLLQLQDELQLLDQEYRNKSTNRESEYAQQRIQMNMMYQEALRQRIAGDDHPGKKSNLKGNMPVQLQMKVLVSQRHFDDNMKRMIIVKEQMAQLERGLGTDAAGELSARNKLEEELHELEDEMHEKHDDLHESKDQKLKDLELQKQDLFGQQKGHSQKMHQIDMAAEAHRRALEKELGPEQVQ